MCLISPKLWVCCVLGHNYSIINPGFLFFRKRRRAIFLLSRVMVSITHLERQPRTRPSPRRPARPRPRRLTDSTARTCRRTSKPAERRQNAPPPATYCTSPNRTKAACTPRRATSPRDATQPPAAAPCSVRPGAALRRAMSTAPLLLPRDPTDS